LEQGGGHPEARELYTKVAASIESNYYPALAARKVDVPEPDLPAARAQDPSLYPLPSAIGALRFHFARALAFRDLRLNDLETSELRALAANAGSASAIRQFVLAAAQSAGAWYDAIVVATKMLAHGELAADQAERVRFPRAYWDLLSRAAARHSLDPYLVIALTRQESMFNP